MCCHIYVISPYMARLGPETYRLKRPLTVLSLFLLHSSRKPPSGEKNRKCIVVIFL